MKPNRVRQLIYAVVAFVALVLSGPMLPIELAIWFSGELLLYLEIVSGVWLMANVTGMKAMWVSAKSRMKALPRSLLESWFRAHPRSIGWVQQGLSLQ